MKALGRTLLAILIIALVGGGIYLGVFRRDLFEATYTVDLVCEGTELEETTIKVTEGKTIKLPTPEREGYTFEGWFNGNEKWTNAKPVHEDLILTAKWKKKDLIINFVDGDESSSQSFSIEQALPTRSKDGYKFEGWTKEGSDQVYTTVVEEIVGATLCPKFSIIQYTISYNLNGGFVVSNPTSYNIETETFTINNPTKENFIFEGWKLNSSTETLHNPYIVTKGSTGNITLTAKWSSETVSVSFVVDGKKIDYSKTLNNGQTLNDVSLNAETLGLSGYTLNFFSDPELTKPQSLTAEIKNDTTIYVSTTYIIENSFYGYLTKFKNATESIEIKSFNELVAWVDYVLFNNITKSNAIKAKLVYKTFSSTSNLLEDVSAAIGEATFSYKNTGYVYWQNNKTDVKIYISNDMTDEAKLVYDQKHEGVLEQVGYVLHSSKSNRTSSFDNFKINNVTKELQVSTSNQLVYALEKGLKPVCVPSSSAELIFNKAKNVLRQICDDEMSDFEKVRAIYEWIILNNSYDHKAADEIVGNTWYKYDSWFAEGVFNSEKAVCDGICKAFLIMAKIEGIPAIRVTGNAHAWNKVYINGNWFGIDATHGDLTVNSSYEALTYAGFLFTDEYKNSQGYYPTEYSNIKATTKLNVYENISFTSGGKTFDLFINNETELKNLLTYIKANEKSSMYTFEIAVDSSSGLTITRINTLIYQTLGSSCSRVQKNDSLGNTTYLFIKN